MRAYLKLSELVGDAAQLYVECAHCHRRRFVPLETMAAWMRRGPGGDLSLRDLMRRLRCTAERCGKRGACLEWEVTKARPAFDQRGAWNGRNHRRRGPPSRDPDPQLRLH